MKCDVLIVGGGTGGTAAAMALGGKGLSVVLTEETDWLGGQFTSQCVPPDEHPWIEQFGCTRRYQSLRFMSRCEFLASNDRRRLRPEAGPVHLLNPGGGWVSRLCMPPAYFAHHLGSRFPRGRRADKAVRTLYETVPVRCEVHENQVVAVQTRCLRTGKRTWFEPRFVLDATELGDLLPMTRTDYVVGAESRQETGEPHAVDGAAEPGNVQAFTWCAAVGWDPVGDHTIDKPDDYDFWRSFVPPDWTGNLLDLTFPNVRTGEPMTLPLFDASGATSVPGGPLTLFGYRQIVDPAVHSEPTEAVTVMNWPQNDYMLGSIIDVADETRREHLRASRQLTLSLLYWLQTEMGFKGLRLRPDITGTEDGLAKSPYIRESRRIRALHTVREQEVATDCQHGRTVAPEIGDSVGIGAYRIDLHPGANGARTIDISALPFQVPLGCLVPQVTQNLLPACKNIGTTHVTNGCFRLHPVEWNIGESAGLLASYCLGTGVTPQDVHASPSLVAGFQALLHTEGVETAWPKIGPL